MRNFAWLVAASAICVMASKEREKAILEVVLYESTEHGDYKTYTYSLSGEFSAAGPAISAEGDIVQVSHLKPSVILLTICLNFTVTASDFEPGISKTKAEVELLSLH